MKIGIIGAMDLEIKKLTTEEMTSDTIVEKAGMKFHIGRLDNTDVVIVKSGVGKVNAAVCAQILIDCFDVTHLINTGIAGSLDHNITNPASSPRWAPRTASKAFRRIPPCGRQPPKPAKKLSLKSASTEAAL